MKVRPKKALGQHFLKDESISKRIADLVSGHGNYQNVLEIGAGTGILTQFLLDLPDFKTYVVEIDRESVAYLKEHQVITPEHIIEGDFLRLNLSDIFEENFAVVGNLPYNISSQIFFKVLEYRHQIPEVVCMIQKEVAQRIASPAGNKQYGILSVFLQAFYDISYEFTVLPHVFLPPPKVDSGVITLRRNARQHLDCPEKLFFRVVKMSFGMRRKTLRNSLKVFPLPEEVRQLDVFSKRPEQLTVAQFEELTRLIAKYLPA